MSQDQGQNQDLHILIGRISNENDLKQLFELILERVPSLMRPLSGMSLKQKVQLINVCDELKKEIYEEDCHCVKCLTEKLLLERGYLAICRELLEEMNNDLG